MRGPHALHALVVHPVPVLQCASRLLLQAQLLAAHSLLHACPVPSLFLAASTPQQVVHPFQALAAVLSKVAAALDPHRSGGEPLSGVVKGVSRSRERTLKHAGLRRPWDIVAAGLDRCARADVPAACVRACVLACLHLGSQGPLHGPAAFSL